MTTQDINKGLIGKEITLMRKGMRVKGTITGIYQAKTGYGDEVLGLNVEHEPVQWGKEVHTSGASIGSNLSTIKFI